MKKLLFFGIAMLCASTTLYPMKNLRYKYKKNLITRKSSSKDNNFIEKNSSLIKTWNDAVLWGSVGTVAAGWIGYNSLSSYRCGTGYGLGILQDDKERHKAILNENRYLVDAYSDSIALTITNEFLLSIFAARLCNYPRGAFTAGQLALFGMGYLKSSLINR